MDRKTLTEGIDVETRLEPGCQDGMVGIIRVPNRIMPTSSFLSMAQNINGFGSQHTHHQLYNLESQILGIHLQCMDQTFQFGQS